LSGVNPFPKVRDRKQRTDIGQDRLVIRTFRNWKKLPAEALGLSLVNLSVLETELRNDTFSLKLKELSSVSEVR
jgi:hypothetical protein